MDNYFNSRRILDLIWKRKVHFIIIGIIAIVLSAIFSGPSFITPKYKSTARLYPSNTGTASEESETEQMLEVLNSNDIKMMMFDAFNLADVYEIDKDDPQYFANMFAQFNEQVTIRKTEYETAEIEVMDEDPQRASDMCDSIISIYSRKVGIMHKLKTKEVLTILETQLRTKRVEKEIYKRKLDSIRTKYGIISFSSQVPEITRGYMRALAAGRGAAADTKKIEKLYKNFEKEGTEAIKIERRFYRANSAIDSLRLLHEVQMIEYSKNISYSHIVEHPFPADKKSYPTRWLIVALSAMSAVFFALLVFLVLDYRKED